MKVEVKNISGKVVKTIDLPDEIYNLELNDHVLHLSVKGYQANRRQGTHCTKTRSYVSGGGKKPFKQKGTGNARQGTSRAPHMPGGAVAHGPRPRSYTQKLNKKMKNLAVKVALSDKARHKKLVVVDDFAISEYSTKQIASSLKNLGVTSALLSDERKDNFLYKSADNIYKVAVRAPSDLNAEDILRHESLVVSENALTTIAQRLEAKKK